ncbi:MAG TPA: hypothetical protein DCM86_05925 [Verrucomicrobiales bacterium]|nr:hypothetical protein [Verrucomicrobiales bacterium]
MNPPALLMLPLGFEGWLPAVQAATLGLLTLVQEDVPTVSAALLASAGSLGWKAAFLGVFLGIWFGDAMLYLVARGIGRPLLRHAWSRRFFDPVAVARSERWFAEKGTWLLLTSRFVPGTRLPTYLAAGFLRLSFGRFMAVTGTAVAVWTLGIFLLAREDPEGSSFLRGPWGPTCRPGSRGGAAWEGGPWWGSPWAAWPGCDSCPGLGVRVRAAGCAPSWAGGCGGSSGRPGCFTFRWR